MSAPSPDESLTNTSRTPSRRFTVSTPHALYFAYGSNLLRARLQAAERAPEAMCRGLALLRGHQLRFHKLGADGSGKADAFWTGSPRDELPGRLFEIPREQLEVLDRVEGVGFGYERVSVHVTSPDSRGLSLEAQTYRALSRAIDPDAVPFDWYLELVRAGAAEIGLPAAHQAALGARTFVVDPDDARRARERSVLPSRWTP